MDDAHPDEDIGGMTTVRGAVVVVDPVSSGRNLRHAILRRGYATIYLITLTDEMLGGPMARFTVGLTDRSSQAGVDAIVRMPNCRDFAAIKRRLLDLPYRIRAVVPGSEIGVETADAIARRLELPSNDPMTMDARREKAAMKQMIVDEGLKSMSFKRCYSERDVELFIETYGLPVVVKTPRGGGTVQVHACRTCQEAAKAYRRVTTEPDFWGRVAQYSVIEELVSGQEYQVNAIGNGREIVITDIWITNKIQTAVADNVYYNEFLVQPGSAETAAVESYVARAAKAVGISRGPVHAEVRLHGGEPVLIEIASRFPGGNMPEMVRQCSGVDLYEMAIDAYVGNTRASAMPRFSELAAIVSCPAMHACSSGRILGLAEIRRLNCYLEDDGGDQHTRIPLVATTDLSNVLLTVWLRGPTRTALEEDASRVHCLFGVECEHGRDVVGQIATR
jgi:hypothetical protein